MSSDSRRSQKVALKKEIPLAIEITPAVERLELGYRFHQECVDNVKIVTGSVVKHRELKELFLQLSLRTRDDYSSHYVKLRSFWTGLVLVFEC